MPNFFYFNMNGIFFACSVFSRDESCFSTESALCTLVNNLSSHLKRTSQVWQGCTKPLLSVKVIVWGVLYKMNKKNHQKLQLWFTAPNVITPQFLKGSAKCQGSNLLFSAFAVWFPWIQFSGLFLCVAVCKFHGKITISTNLNRLWSLKTRCR